MWDPTSSEITEQEYATMNYKGEVITLEATARGNSYQLDDANFGLALENEVAVSRVGLSNSTAKPKVDYLTLRKKWGISPEIVNKKLQVTTKSGIRNVLHMSLSQGFMMND